MDNLLSLNKNLINNYLKDKIVQIDKRSLNEHFSNST